MPSAAKNKRRKTGKATTQERQPGLIMSLPSHSKKPPLVAAWPAGRVPVEIFTQIIRYLPHSSLRAMRLVCREFEDKVSAEYFKHVVVSFRPALYNSFEGSQLQGGKDLTPMSGSRMLAAGTRVFQDFGYHVRAFALAIELNEAELAYPPVKCNQKTVTAFWGIYRWPHDAYTRYDQMQLTEDIADETEKLAETFSFLPNIQELALSCDSGLGYLRGPDIDLNYPLRLGRVLKSSQQQPPEAPTLDDAFASNALRIEEGKTEAHMMLKRMVRDAGYKENQVADAIKIVMENEFLPPFNTGVIQSLVNYQLFTRIEDPVPATRCQIEAATGHQPQWRSLENGNAAPNANQPSDGGMARDGGIPRNGKCPTCGGQCNQGKTSDISEFPKALAPARLTTAQLELLLELEWAQRALVQSFSIVVVDRFHQPTFLNLRNLTIARIPASHVESLARPCFWKALPTVENLSLGVIPDWRKLGKYGRFGNVVESKEEPSESLGPVFNLLQICGTHATQVRSLHFEWICGGELAHGTSQRDRYVLPAPFYKGPQDMVAPRPPTSLTDSLWIPHIEHLSLKNCWFTPHAFVQAIRAMTTSASCSLQTVELESVSLTGPPTVTPMGPIFRNQGRRGAQDHHPWPLCAGGRPGSAFNLFHLGGPPPVNVGPPLPQPLVNMPGPHLLPPFAMIPPQVVVNDRDTAVRNRVPVLMSWAHVINELTPSLTIEDSLHELNVFQRTQVEVELESLQRRLALFLERAPERRTDAPSTLKSLKFKSCGYVIIDIAEINNWPILPDRIAVVPQTEATLQRLRELDDVMQIPSDPYLGTILNHMHECELKLLQPIFGMVVGWDGIYDADFARAAKLDGNPVAGKGRFSGECVRGVAPTPVFPGRADD